MRFNCFESRYDPLIYENGSRKLFFLKNPKRCFVFSNPFLNLLTNYENNRKQILVVAFFNFPRESSESRCLNFAQHISQKAYWISR
ncbi:MAG: hypothetical protein B7Z16_13460 [Algoriphagus sp. 32-45-6]|nr:MAG: hypothetical protein B7Z16_13460 [Algoriphagus sp. 32-45-6]